MFINGDILGHLNAFPYLTAHKEVQWRIRVTTGAKETQQ
jgi:hypothetical protein